MTPLDVVIVAVYITCLIYVFRQSLKNMEDWVTVQFDQATLSAQLKEKNLQNAIAIRFALKPRYTFETIADLSLSISNTSEAPIYVDWDRSTLTNFAGRSRRVIRITPTMNLDLSQPQVFSVIAPGKVLSERVVAEDMLRRTSEGVLQIASPLVDLSIARGLPADRPVDFSIRLLLRMVPLGSEAEEDDLTTQALLCRFLVRRIPWDDKMPWKKK